MTIVTIVHKPQMKASAHPIDLELRVADYVARVLGVCGDVEPAKRCDREKLNRGDWRCLLDRQPQFASTRPKWSGLRFLSGLCGRLGQITRKRLITS